MAPFGQSRMLPREAYVDQAVFDWEQQHIFSGWTCVGHAADVAAVGAQKAVGTGANAVLLVRGDDDTVRAFANTCRHRGHELLACNATTKGRSTVCPYHSWSYRLDGSLRNAPHFPKVEGFDADQFGLAELKLVNWHGWLFVDPSGEDTDFPDHVAGWEGILAPYRPEDLTVVDQHELRTVMYVVGYPNLLISLHPDYVMTHLMTPLAVDRTHVECAWAFPKEVAEKPDFDPSYAVDFWDLTNRQDWAACESVQRGLTSPHARPGPLAPDEDGVYQFVSRVATAYAGGVPRGQVRR
jgi:phenylpropionate dioxygenase-like ring-hydroxylating dioxygenase large terminal subunit